ncbi:phage major capsid protein [Croceicoccus marinus]|uniref:Phage major capsid protein n=1 Tax=Croceicoccus marinus TaxID=450378 RepID=A0A7G6VSH1_9SPHN|nr:phage major capsid protein [Croceicoccus marinus]QNE04686.1 phage major capsid protein [Croceicoccus marinus]
MKNLEDLNNTVERIGAENNKMLNGIDARLEELEKKYARGGGSLTADDYQNSWGKQFVHAKVDELSQVESLRGKTSMEVRAALTTTDTPGDGAAGGLIVPGRDRMVGMPKRRLLIRSLLSVVKVDSANSIEYPELVGRTNNAGMVAEGAAKPESSLQFELKSVPLRVMAHWMKASRQVLSDAPQLQGIIDNELRYGLALKEEAQLLYGDNTGQNFNGMIPQAADFVDSLGAAAPTAIDTIGSAIHQASLTDVPPDGIVLHPSDWWKMRMLKDVDGKYLLGDPMMALEPSLFGLPVVLTQSINVDEFLVGAFSEQTLYDRWTARVEVGFVDQDFTNNMVTVLGEERVGFAAKRPEALIHGTFTPA